MWSCVHGGNDPTPVDGGGDTGMLLWRCTAWVNHERALQDTPRRSGERAWLVAVELHAGRGLVHRV